MILKTHNISSNIYNILLSINCFFSILYRKYVGVPYKLVDDLGESYRPNYESELWRVEDEKWSFDIHLRTLKMHITALQNQLPNL